MESCPQLLREQILNYSPSQNNIGMLFLDFYETTNVVDLAIAYSNDTTYEWADTKIVVAQKELQSTEGPAVTVYQNQLYMLYKGQSSDDIWQAVYDPASGWISNQKIKDLSSIAPKTNKSPSVAAQGDSLYLVYKDNDSNDIRQAVLTNGTWTGDQKIKDISAISPQTDNSPYLTTFGSELVMVHKASGKDELHWARFNGSWYSDDQVQVSDQTVETNKTAGRHRINGALYLLYKGAHTNDLYQSVYQNDAWSGNVNIKDLPDTVVNPESDEGPGVVRFGSAVYMFYKGEALDDLYVALFPGYAWGGNEKLSDISSIQPQSNRSPMACQLGDTLYLLYKGESDTLYQSSLQRVAMASKAVGAAAGQG